MRTTGVVGEATWERVDAPAPEQTPPDPQALLAAAIAQHNLDGKRMLELAFRGEAGATKMAALCDGFSELSAKRQMLL